jgi:hypothetical protein
VCSLRRIRCNPTAVLPVSKSQPAPNYSCKPLYNVIIVWQRETVCWALCSLDDEGPEGTEQQNDVISFQVYTVVVPMMVVCVLCHAECFVFFPMFRRNVLPRSLGWLNWFRRITHSCALKMAALDYFETSEQTKNSIRFKNPKDDERKTVTLYTAWNWRVRLSFQSRLIVMGVPKGIKRRAFIIQDITYTAAPNNWIEGFAAISDI